MIENFNLLPKKIVTFVPKSDNPPPPPPMGFFKGRARKTRERGEETPCPFLPSRVLEVSSFAQKTNRCYDTVQLVFLEISDYLDWSATSCNSSVGNYVCSSLTVYATVLVLLLFRVSSDPKRPRATSIDQQRDPL